MVFNKDENNKKFESAISKFDDLIKKEQNK